MFKRRLSDAILAACEKHKAEYVQDLVETMLRLDDVPDEDIDKLA